MTETTAVVGVIMGSDSDWPTMRAAAEALDRVRRAVRGAGAVGAPHARGDARPTRRDAAARGLRVIIAGAGGAAHLPGMVASVTPLPVIGVPVPLKHLDGMDSLLSIVQMPAGVPVATVSIGGARNAGLLAVRILAANDTGLRGRMEAFQDDLRAQVEVEGRARYATVSDLARRRSGPRSASRASEVARAPPVGGHGRPGGPQISTTGVCASPPPAGSSASTSASSCWARRPRWPTARPHRRRAGTVSIVDGGDRHRRPTW